MAKREKPGALTRRAFLVGSASSLLISPISTRNAYAKSGVPWKVGMSAALSGPAKALGEGMRDGISAWFAAVNAQGGIHGRPIELLTLDDGYEPLRAAPNMHKLVEEENVFAVMGNTGTPTAAVTVPLANELKVPLFGAFTGAGLLRKTPPDRYILNYRASYHEETGEMIRGLIEDIGLRPEKIALFTQNDAYGDSGYLGATKALQARGYAKTSELVHGRYPRNTLYVEDGLSRILDPRHDIRAVVMIGAYKPCAQLILQAKAHRLRALFINVSFVGSDALRRELAGNDAGVVVTQVVPHPSGGLPALADFRRIVPAAAQNFVSLEGFMVARAFTQGLQLMPPDGDREAFIDTLQDGAPLELGLGETVRLSTSEHQLSHKVYPTSLEKGQFIPFSNWKALRGHVA